MQEDPPVRIHVWPQPPRLAGGWVILTADVVLGDDRHRLWYRLPDYLQGAVPTHHNHWVLATLFLAMGRGADLHIHGVVDRTLLINLVEFQAAWIAWQPHYQMVNITADQELDIPPVDNMATVMAFSGGVDSCFTLWRHTQGAVDRQRQPLQAGVMVHGFDIPLDQVQVFESALAKGKQILDSVGIELIVIATNFRELPMDWEDSHGAAIVSCLTLLDRRFNAALIASGPSYKSLVFPQGSNPLSDHYLSSLALPVIHDGAGYSRLEKIQAIATWPEMRQNLRVCWQGAQLDTNCCQCEKCIRNILSFRVWGAGLPECFPQDASNEQIQALEVPQAQLEVDFIPIARLARSRNINDSWVDALEKCIRKHQRRYAIKTAIAAFKQQLPRSIKYPLWRLRKLLIGR